MVSRRLYVFTVLLSALVATAASFFALGVIHARRRDLFDRAADTAKIESIRADVRRELEQLRHDEVLPIGAPAGASAGVAAVTGGVTRSSIVTEVKRELQSEMGLLPVHLLRDRRASFVELYSSDNLGKMNYGTAGYLGGGYFITVKHAVVALSDDADRRPDRRIVSIKVVVNGKDIPAKLYDAGDANVEVHRGDWAIIKTKEVDLPALHPDTSFAYDFADPIFRLGNDYSKGIILSTGYIGEHTSNGLITCLTDGHPGVSGGGVLDQNGDLVGIPIGRMQGDYRFSFILPLRAEMLRNVQAKLRPTLVPEIDPRPATALVAAGQ